MMDELFLFSIATRQKQYEQKTGGHQPSSGMRVPPTKDHEYLVVSKQRTLHSSRLVGGTSAAWVRMSFHTLIS